MRVLVTRAAEDAPALAAALAAVGVEPVVVPLIAREVDAAGVRAALAAHPRPDVLLLTSAAAARVLAAHRPEGFAPARVACVGPPTAAAAREAGLVVDVLPDEATGVATVAALGELRGRTVLYVQAAASVPATREALRGAGAVVVDVPAYVTGPAPDGATRLAAARPFALVTLASPSTARAYAAAAGDLAHAVPAVVTGPTTRAACAELGIPVAAVAEPHTAAGMVAAVGRLAGA